MRTAFKKQARPKKVTHHLLSSKSWLIMRLTLILMTAACLQVTAKSVAQKINLADKNTPIEKVFNQIQQQSGYNFFYKQSALRLAEPVTVYLKDGSIQTALELCFKNQPRLTYSLVDNVVIIKQKTTQPVSDETANEQAPQHEVHGIVRDSAGKPLGGVSVVVAGTKKGTLTNTVGEYSVNADQGDVLEFNFVGYQTKRVAVTESNEVDVQLNALSTQLNDIVIVGYSTQKKGDLTGAVGIVNSEQLENRPVTNTTNALEGTVPGVTIVATNGQPGYDAGTIKVRGIGTLNNSNPMIVVDGNIVSSMNDVDPNDIATISVLKDAASSAIYGSRAANGVVLITTKKGKAGTTQISYNDYFGKQKATALPDYVPSWQAATLYNEALENEGHAAQYTDAQIDSFKLGTSPYNYPNTDWLGLFYSGSGFQQDHNLNMSGGTDKTQYFFSLGYFDENGIVPKTNTQRYTTRLNLSSKVTNKLTVFGNLSYTYQPIMQPQSTYPGVASFLK